MQRIDVAERRARLARRHRLAPGHRARDVVEAARAWSACTRRIRDRLPVRLGAHDGMTVPDLERALYAERSLVKHLAMRRTLFVFPRDTSASPRRGPATASLRASGAG